MASHIIEELTDLLTSLPGIGRRSAQRIAFQLIAQDSHATEQLGRAIMELPGRIRFCERCGNLTEDRLCSVCEDPSRDQTVMCVIEEPSDIYAIEATGEMRGTYHVLMGALSPLDGIGPENLRIEELAVRLQQEPVSEVFIATNPTLEGDATAHYIQERFRDEKLRFTRISHGIPTGAEIEFADRSALARSIRDRTDLKWS